ncbi:hypothetical protein EF879_02205 [Micromonospora sp. HM5-17]|nr:hypothetical protein [Micromonospora sp. HM5-17]ROT34333.1 hypothetical protein EF879_02205 [Micromonospora sp. HM5-17]
MAQPDEDFAPGARLTPDERDLEAPDADAAEQATVADPTVEDQVEIRPGLEVDEYDAFEQSRIVGYEDDDYR